MEQSKQQRASIQPGANDLRLATLLSPAQVSVTVEDRLILLCARVHPTEEDYREIADIGSHITDLGWNYVIETARANGVDTLLFTHIARAGLLPLLQQEHIGSLRLQYELVTLTTRRLEQRLGRILPLLREADAPVIVLKGVTIARRLYGDIPLRPISDIDMLARLHDKPRWARALSEAGFTPVPGRSAPLSSHVLRFRELQFRNADRQTVEMHINLCRYPAYQRAFPMREIWARARQTSLCGHPALALDPIDELAFLCFHYATQHRVGRLIWLTDIAEISRQEFDQQHWEAFAADIIARGVAAPTAVALTRAQTLLDAPVPEPVLQQLRQAAARPAERLAWEDALRPMRGIRWYFSQMRAMETPLERAALLWNGGLTLTRQLHARVTYSLTSTR